MLSNFINLIGIFSFCTPSIYAPQVTKNVSLHGKSCKILQVRLRVADSMHPLSWGSTNRKILLIVTVFFYSESIKLKTEFGEIFSVCDSFPSLVGAFYLDPFPDARATFLHNDLLCNDTCSVNGGAQRTAGGTNGKDPNSHLFCCEYLYITY